MVLTISDEHLEMIARAWFREYDEHRHTGSLGESIEDEFMQEVVKPMMLPKDVEECIEHAVYTNDN